MTLRNRRVVETAVLVLVFALLLAGGDSGLQVLGVLVLVLLLAGALWWVWRPGRPEPKRPDDRG